MFSDAFPGPVHELSGKCSWCNFWEEDPTPIPENVQFPRNNVLFFYLDVHPSHCVVNNHSFQGQLWNFARYVMSYPDYKRVNN